MLHAKPCRRPSWSLWRHGRGLAGAEDISHRECIGWRSALWCSFLLWSLPVLHRRSSPLVASTSKYYLQHDFALGDWWALLFCSSGTAAGCLSWEVWWLRTGSMELAILLSAKSCCNLSWERWFYPLHLLGPVLLGCCRLQLTSLSSMIVLQSKYGEALVHCDGLSKHSILLMWKIIEMRKVCPFLFSQIFCITLFSISLLQNVTLGSLVYFKPNFVMLWCVRLS